MDKRRRGQAKEKLGSWPVSLGQGWGILAFSLIAG